MAESLRLVVGFMGNAASLLLFAAPALTFSRVVRKRSAEGFSCIPYTLGLLNCLIYTWYGSPVVSYGLENFLVITINGLGIILELTFLSIYFGFASPRGKIKVAVTGIPILVAFCVTAVMSVVLFHDHHSRKVFVGSVGLVASVAMYGSPLVVVKQVVLKKSVEFMPFYLSLFSFIASLTWMAYGLLSHDLLLALPNIVGSPLGFLQLVVYFKYRKRTITDEKNKCELEEMEDKPKQLQLVICDTANNKFESESRV